MFDKSLSEKQKVKLAQLLSDAATNKEMPHVLDLGRAAVILYDVVNMGYDVNSDDMDEILNNSEDDFSEYWVNDLKHMVDAYHDLVSGLKNGARRVEESALE